MTARTMIAALGVLVLAPWCTAQDDAGAEARIRALEEQNRKILERLDRSESRNLELERKLVEVEATKVGDEFDHRLENALNAITQDAVTYESLVKSGNVIQIYGFVRLDAYYNTGRANSVIIPAFALPEGNGFAKRNDDAFALDARLTRVGLNVNAGRIGSADVTAKLETDFANFPPGVPESRETPRIRLAYIDLDFGAVTLRFGQDWDTIAPLYPAVNAELLLWNAGNLGDRRPQVQVIWTPEPGPSGVQFTLEAAAGLTGAIDNQDLDTGLTTTERDGFDSGHPHGQLRMALAFDSWVAGKRAEIGAWGAVGGLETDTNFGGSDHFTSWLAGLDVQLPLFDSFLFRAEAWVGQALADFRGGIAQTINTGTGEEIQSVGGFFEFWWQATDAWRLHVGGSFDDPDRDDLGGGARDLNWTAYVGTYYDWGGGLVTGLDVLYWETQYVDVGLGNFVRVNAYIQLNF